jgi:hypothetical protein
MGSQLKVIFIPGKVNGAGFMTTVLKVQTQ